MFNAMSFQPPIRTTTPVVRHNFKSIDELLSPLPNSITSTPSQRYGKANFEKFLSDQVQISISMKILKEILSLFIELNRFLYI